MTIDGCRTSGMTNVDCRMANDGRMTIVYAAIITLKEVNGNEYRNFFLDSIIKLSK